MSFVRKVHGANQLPENLLAPDPTMPTIQRLVPKKAPTTNSSPEKSNGDMDGADAPRNLKQPLDVPVSFAQVEWEQSSDLTKISKAFVAFRKECPNPGKDKRGYNYSYTTLTNVVETSRAPLAKHGLAVTQLPVNSGNNLGVITMLIHESGQYWRCRFVMPIPALKGTNITQDAGACLTYARRYGLSAVLGMVSDEDTDAT